MSTPIEELLGWEPEGNVGWYDPEGEWHHHAEVDDLAAWLISMGETPQIKPMWNHMVAPPAFVGWGVFDGDDYFPLTEARTPRCALADAVRRVAGDE